MAEINDAIKQQIRQDFANKMAQAQRQRVIGQGLRSPQAGIRSAAYSAQLKGLEPKPTAEEKLMEKTAEVTATTQARGEGKKKEAQLKASTNFGRVASAIEDFAKYYAGSIEEGGAGGPVAKMKGSFFTQSALGGGERGEKYRQTGKLFGQRAELALSMMPILTNQNRFIASIMDYINKSLPQGQEGPGLAADKLDQTLRNQYRITKVLKSMGIDPEQPEQINQMSDDEAADFAQRVIQESAKATFELDQDEESEYEEIKKKILGPLYEKTQDEEIVIEID